ncbi:MAG: DUF4442 domain-containing protein [Bacteroidetes bacterium]|nr:DUF4442 domain-containing protein [Bacteroidota bacterium]MDA1335639.1 DUF4442 domain-containing protein [Bacteroidota bacterium]
MMQKWFDWALIKAKGGQVFWLNFIFKRILPFNAPHGIRILELNEEGVKVRLPSKRANRNHLKGMHACAIATACEFCSGLAVLSKFQMNSYRLIMNRLEVDYLRRAAPGDCLARAEVSNDLKDQILRMIEQDEKGAARFQMVSTLYDSNGEAVAIATVHWHVKSWDRVQFKPTA